MIIILDGSDLRGWPPTLDNPTAVLTIILSDPGGEPIDNFRHAKPGADISVTWCGYPYYYMCHSYQMLMV